ncbi:hypothetical protein HALDL1_09690 [Halobacterium sp. DL1]|nr:hypothetical protein HALDL1_09690 [Halobacterium sp. DL1]
MPSRDEKSIYASEALPLAVAEAPAFIVYIVSTSSWRFSTLSVNETVVVSPFWETESFSRVDRICSLPTPD